MAGRCKEGVMGGRQVPSGGQVIGRSAELYSNGPPESQSVTGRGQEEYCIVWEEVDGTHAGQIVHSASRRGFPGPGRSALYCNNQFYSTKGVHLTSNAPTNLRRAPVPQLFTGVRCVYQ